METDHILSRGEFVKILDAVENQEFWTLDSSKIELFVKQLCKLLSTSQLQVDENVKSYVTDILAYVKISRFVQILLSAEQNNFALIESIVTYIQDSQEDVLPAQHVIVCRSKLICGVALYCRVFSTKRLELILGKLKEIK